MKKINLKGISEILSEKELRNVMGGFTKMMASGGKEDDSTTSGPCKNNGCSGPHGTWVGGKLCCLLPCNGTFGPYGYGLVSGMSKCPW
jgi:natural product precursor